jgi:cytochrome c peroxidase
MNKIVTIFVVFTFVLVACTKGDLIIDNPTPPIVPIEPIKSLQLPTTLYNYANVALPQHILHNVIEGLDQTSVIFSDNTPDDNPITDAGATLGRVLFYDKNLSQNGRVACASCHKQANGFADSRALSIGMGASVTRRNSMTLTNARFNRRGKFFWDERASSLEEQVLMPFQNNIEMGEILSQLTQKIKAQSYYKDLFVTAFGNETVSNDKISKALAQFIRSLISTTSRYDEGRANVAHPRDDFPNFTTQENKGKKLFFEPISSGGMACIECHSTEAFINPAFGTTSNGLDAVSSSDLGVFESNPLDRLKGTFKMTSLKNIGVTGPYMHDGRLSDLRAVVEFYNSGIQPHPNLGLILKKADGTPQRFNLTPAQIDEMVAFLLTLTDEPMLIDPKLSDPFR